LLRALPTETKVESGTSQSKSGTYVDSSNSGLLERFSHLVATKNKRVGIQGSVHARAEFRVQGAWFKVQGAGFRVQGAGFNVQDSGFRVCSSGFRVQGSGFRVQGSKFRIQS